MGHPLLPDCRAPSMSDMWGGILGASTLSLVLSFPLMTPYPLSLMCQDAFPSFFFFRREEGSTQPHHTICTQREAGQGESPGSGQHELGREGSESWLCHFLSV